MTETSAGLVRITVKDGVGDAHTYYLDPGCTVTRTVNREVNSVARPGQKNKLINLGRNENDIIRIDTTVSNYGLDSGSGFVNDYNFITYLEAQTYSTTTPATILWRSNTYTGLIKSFTVTQASGEGNLIHVSIVFEVGDL